MDVLESDKFGIICSGGDCKGKTIKKLLFKNLNKTMEYLIPKASLVFI